MQNIHDNIENRIEEVEKKLKSLESSIDGLAFKLGKLMVTVANIESALNAEPPEGGGLVSQKEIERHVLMAQPIGGVQDCGICESGDETPANVDDDSGTANV